MFSEHLQKIVTIICVYILLLSCLNNNPDITFKVDLDTDKTYILYRGTKTKEGNIAKRYNLSDSLSTHVGLLIYTEDLWHVYHVQNTGKEETHLKKENLSFFIDEKINVYYASLWELCNLEPLENKKLKHYVKSLDKVIIKFDKSFSSIDSTKLYCSEFVNNALHIANPQKYNFKKNKVVLKPLYAKILKRDSLEYYSTDVFQQNPNIVKISEWFFEE